MRRQQKCPKCRSQEVGHLESLLDSTEPRLDLSYQALGTIEGYRPANDPAHPILNRRLDSRAYEIKAGTIEAYVCTECGHVERYAQDPHWLPFSKLKGFSWVNVDADEHDVEVEG